MVEEDGTELGGNMAERILGPLSQRLFGLPPRRAANLMAYCFAFGGIIELFMIKVWIKETNCARSCAAAHACK